MRSHIVGIAVACAAALGVLGGCASTAAPGHGAASCPPRGAGETALVIGGFSSPESVAMAGARVFVSNIGARLDPLAKDGDGFISEVDRTGRIVALRSFPREGAVLHAPKGLAVVAGRLYTADIDRVVGFDLRTGAMAFEARVEGAQPALVNGLAATASGELLVTDTLRGTLSRLDLASGRFTVLADGMPGANGVAVDESKGIAWVVGIGAKFEGGGLHQVPLRGTGSQRIDGPNGLFDGIEVLSPGLLAISDWRALDNARAGDIGLYEPGGTRVGTVFSSKPLAGPADFRHDAACRQLWVPNTLLGEVHVLNLP